MVASVTLLRHVLTRELVVVPELPWYRDVRGHQQQFIPLHRQLRQTTEAVVVEKHLHDTLVHVAQSGCGYLPIPV